MAYAYTIKWKRKVYGILQYKLHDIKKAIWEQNNWKTWVNMSQICVIINENKKYRKEIPVDYTKLVNPLAF